MKKYFFTFTAIAVLTLATALPALACSMAGPDKHVGQVTAVDTKAGTFTVMDAETRKPITFFASSSIIRDAKKSHGSVMVSFETFDGKLVAKDIHF